MELRADESVVAVRFTAGLLFGKAVVDIFEQSIDPKKVLEKGAWKCVS